MIRKLQRKFIFSAMGVLLAVLLIIITGINVVNYIHVVRDADELLYILSHNRGRFPENEPFSGPPIPPHLSPEIPFETRFFSVVYDIKSGDRIQIDTGHIISVTSAEAAALADRVMKQDNVSGFLGDYRFLQHTESNYCRVIFLDCGRKLESFRDFLLASTFISPLGYLVVVCMMSLLSRRIVRPISESYEKQKRFITDASHEIKTPLTIIGADTDVLEMEMGDNEWLQDIRKQTRRLASLTNNLVMLARMEEGGQSVPMIQFPVSDVVDEAAAEFQTIAHTQNKQLLLNIHPMLSLTGYDKAIHQLVSILLDNAIKYSPEHSTVTLSLDQHGHTLRLTVSNMAINPLPAENLNVLFERFYRTDPSRSSETGGYGIGLSVAKAIVENHRGRIQASTNDGCTLTITALFPVQTG